MIQLVENIEEAAALAHSYLNHQLHENIGLDAVYKMVEYAVEEPDSYCYGIYNQEKIIGLFTLSVYEHLSMFDNQSIILDYAYCFEEETLQEMLLFLKEKYKDYTMNVTFFKKEEQALKFFEQSQATLEPLNHFMIYSPYMTNSSFEESSITVVPYETKQDKLFKKLKATASKDTFVALKKRKPVGFIKLDPSNETIYIDDLVVLPKYENKGIKKELVESIIKKYSSYEIMVIVSCYDEQEIEFYKKLGFEIDDKNTSIDVTLLLK